jgi:citrate/tricarballylate utilization protein
MHATKTLEEADRLMTVCNSCRYCEGLCAVFPAMELRRSFADGDLDYLANLCHSCGACFIDCQFAPPHEFAVNVPQTLAKVRNDSYATYAWPPGARRLIERSALFTVIVAFCSLVGFTVGFTLLSSRPAPFPIATHPGDFYVLLPHDIMAMLFGTAFLYGIFAMAMGLRYFMRGVGASPKLLVSLKWLRRASIDAAELRYLEGGGSDCFSGEERVDRRRLFHHLTFYGFMLCFASTSTATLYHYFLNREAPYPFWDLPVVLGTLGGIGLLIGPAGLLHAKLTRGAMLTDRNRHGMDIAFIAMLFATSLSGLALLALRSTPMMGSLLVVHLAIVFTLFVTMPYGKFVHGMYRFAALVIYAREKDSLEA